MAEKKPAAKVEGQTATGENGTPGFEEALERLETIVEELESGALTLEDSIARYEEGMRLSRRLTQTLDAAEKRIERLVQSERGEATTEAMELDTEAENPGEAPASRSGSRRDAGDPTSGPDELPF